MLSGRNSGIHLILFTSAYTGSSMTLSADLDDMVESGRERNAAEGVTGVLFCQNGRIVGILEGDRPTLRTRLAEIASDGRYRDIHVLIDDPADERGYSNLSRDSFSIGPDVPLPLETLLFMRDAYRRNFTPNSVLLVSVLKDFVEHSSQTAKDCHV